VRSSPGCEPDSATPERDDEITRCERRVAHQRVGEVRRVVADRYCDRMRDEALIAGDHDSHASVVGLDFDFVIDLVVERNVRVHPEQHAISVAYRRGVGN
jgi:hypothetical protein